MIYLICGEQDILCKKRINQIVNNYLENDVNDFNYSVIDLERNSITSLIEECATFAFGYEFKVVLATNPFFLLGKSEKDVKCDFKNNYDELLDYIENENKNTILIIYARANKLDERLSLVKTLKKKAKYEAIQSIQKGDWNNYVRQVFNEKGIKIDNDGFNEFIKRVGTDMNDVNNEIDKLSLYSKNISKVDVEALVPIPLEDNIYAISDDILSNNIAHALLVFRDLRIQNEEPIRIINTIASQLRLIYQVGILKKDGNSESEIATILKVHPYRVSLAVKKLRYVNLNDLLYILNELSRLDLEIKSSISDRFQAFELFLTRLI